MLHQFVLRLEHAALTVEATISTGALPSLFVSMFCWHVRLTDGQSLLKESKPQYGIRQTYIDLNGRGMCMHSVRAL